jgi:hypothetical protein
MEAFAKSLAILDGRDPLPIWSEKVESSVGRCGNWAVAIRGVPIFDAFV